MLPSGYVRSDPVYTIWALHDTSFTCPVPWPLRSSFSGIHRVNMATSGEFGPGYPSWLLVFGSADTWSNPDIKRWEVICLGIFCLCYGI